MLLDEHQKRDRKQKKILKLVHYHLTKNYHSSFSAQRAQIQTDEYLYNSR